MKIVINSAWQGQRTTGQQRYAEELTRRLGNEPDVELRPREAPHNPYVAWALVQTLAVPRNRAETLVTLTSRGPLWHPHHVIAIHDHFVLTNPEWYSSKYVRTHAPILRAQIAGARGLVFVSEATRQRHFELFDDRLPSVVAPNGISQAKQFPASSPRLKERFLLVVGSQDPRKNVARLVEAFCSLQTEVRGDCRLIIAGGGNSAVFASSGTGPSAPQVTQLGYVSDEELWALYSGALSVVVPSLAEGFGLPLVEAASVGTRLVLSDIPVFRWIAGERATYFDPLDTQSIAHALELTLAGEAPTPDPGIASRFSWDRSAALLLEFLREL